MSPSPCSFTTSLDESSTLMVSFPIIFCLTLTYLLSSRVRNLFLTNTPSATTGITPFFANKGYHPNLIVHPERDLASTHAHDFVTDLDELHHELWQHIAEAQHRYQA